MSGIEEQRVLWSRVAKQNGWFTQPCFLIVWVGKDGEIQDSVSHHGLDRDYVIHESE
jgi:hypothetical protein